MSCPPTMLCRLNIKECLRNVTAKAKRFKGILPQPLDCTVVFRNRCIARPVPHRIGSPNDAQSGFGEPSREVQRSRRCLSRQASAASMSRS